MMISFEETVRLVRIQERLRNATYHLMNKGEVYKSAEGAISISYCLPPVVGDSEKPSWVVEAYSYLLNPEGRFKKWSGLTASEAIGKAEDEVKSWCFEVEMEQFDNLVLSPEDADGDDREDPLF